MMQKHLAKSTQIFIDLFILSASYWLAFLLRFEFSLSHELFKLLVLTWPYVLIFQYLLLAIFNVPSFSWRYISLHEVSKISFALGFSTIALLIFRLGLASVGGYFRYLVLPLGVIGINFSFSLLGIIGIRVCRRSLSESIERKSSLKNNGHKKHQRTPSVNILLLALDRLFDMQVLVYWPLS